jgi:Ca-activated chloride channel family protein
VLISDGEDFGGEIAENLDALKEDGVRIFAVGIGSEQGEPIPLLNKAGDVVGYRKDETGQTVMTRLDKAGLMRLAEATQGEFFYQPKSVAMGEVVARIDQLQKSELESRITVRYQEAFQPFVAAGLGFLALGMLLRASRRVRA